MVCPGACLAERDLQVDQGLAQLRVGESGKDQWRSAVDRRRGEVGKESAQKLTGDRFESQSGPNRGLAEQVDSSAATQTNERGMRQPVRSATVGDDIEIAVVWLDQRTAADKAVVPPQAQIGWGNITQQGVVR